MLQEMEKSALIVLVGVLLCNVDALRYKPFDNLKVDPNLDLKYKLDDKKDQKEKNWHLGIEPSITNNYPGLKASLDYQKNNFRAGVDYKYQKTPFNDLHTVGGNIGYDNGKFHLQGRGHIDNTGNWGGGVGFGWRYKRSLRKVRILRNSSCFMLIS